MTDAKPGGNALRTRESMVDAANKRTGGRHQANAKTAGGGGGGWKDPSIYKRKAAREAQIGRTLTMEEFRSPKHWTAPPPDTFSEAGLVAMRAMQTKAIGTQGWVQDKIAEGDIEGGMAAGQSGTSIFDPVLCEIAYRWFCPPGGVVLDPFAGGSVRGIVASVLGRRYHGVDLRLEQAAANEVQAAEICKGDDPPIWYVGDARDVVPTLKVKADFLFSCPPYGDLEVYSDNPLDLSAMNRTEFISAYREIIAASVAKLRNHRFACFLVGDYRMRDGFYANFPGETVAAFEAAGARLYNEAILVTAAGSLPIRAGKQFSTTKKLGKTHQNLLVFCKGDARMAAGVVGEVEMGDDPFMLPQER